MGMQKLWLRTEFRAFRMLALAAPIVHPPVPSEEHLDGAFLPQFLSFFQALSPNVHSRFGFTHVLDDGFSLA